MYSDRITLYQAIEEKRGSRVLAYVTGDRQGMETAIARDILNYLADHLDTFNLPDKISLILYSRGGATLVAWTIVNTIKLFCEEFEVIIPSNAHSAATMICIGADRIIMTKQATLGPIDPSTNSPYNPQAPGAPAHSRLPVSVEHVAGFFDLARQELGETDSNTILPLLLKLSDHVHPVALGNVYRARSQIKMLAQKLLKFHMADDDKIDRIVAMLCSESGSHDYTISRREARNVLELPVENPDADLYDVIKIFFDDIRGELLLDTVYNPSEILGNQPSTTYTCTRALLESVSGGSNKFQTHGTITRTKISNQQGLPEIKTIDQRTKEGWIHEGTTTY